MVTHGRGTSIEGCYVVSGALETRSRMFAPTFVIHEGCGSHGRVLHEHLDPVPGALELSTVEDAFDTADEMAGLWLAEHVQRHLIAER